MKRILLLLLCLALTSLSLFAQGEFQIRLGGGLGVYVTQSSTTLTTAVGEFTDEDQNSAVTLHLPLELRFAVSRRFNAGLDMKLGSYLYEPDSAEGKSNRFAVFGIAAEYSIIAEENVRWYTGIGLNGGSLILEETDNGSGQKQLTTYNGTGLKVNSGLMVFLTDNFGLNFNMGLDVHAFRLKEYERNGSAVNLSNVDGELIVSGLDMALGVIVKL